MSSPATSATLMSAFSLLTDLVSDWRAHNRRTTTAGITSALPTVGIDTESLGFTTRDEFWKAAEAASVVERRRLPNGHWYLLLPGEDLPEEIVTAATGSTSSTPTAASQHRSGATPRPDLAATRSTARASGPHRLRNDVWNAFVDWESAYRRFWDRTHLRAFFVPADWAPAEPASERFVEIEPASFVVQMAWMHNFASEQNEEVRAALTDALAEGAPRGAFRRELNAQALTSQWRTRHRALIDDLIADWASANSLDHAALLDNRATNSPVKAPSKPAPAPVSASPAADTPTPTPAATSPGTPEEHARLREQMHRVIDAMSFDELAAVPIRAAHLLH